MATCMLIGAVYVFACLIVYRNDRLLEDFKNNRTSRAAMTREVVRQDLHDSVFLRTLADKQQFYPHDPQLVDRLYREAIWKGPADCQAYVALAEYLGAKKCCEIQISQLWKRAVQRCPAESKILYTAGLYHFSIQDRESAFAFLKRSLELEPRLGKELYPALQSLGAGQEMLFEVTPENSSAEIDLVRYVGNTQSAPAPQLKAIILRRKNLQPREDLMVAQTAWKYGWDDITQVHASRAADHEETRPAACSILAELSWKQGDGASAEKFWLAAERAFLDRGNPQKAADTALAATKSFASKESPDQTIQRLNRILRDYPDFYPARRELNRLNH